MSHISLSRQAGRQSDKINALALSFCSSPSSTFFMLWSLVRLLYVRLCFHLCICLFFLNALCPSTFESMFFSVLVGSAPVTKHVGISFLFYYVILLFHFTTVNLSISDALHNFFLRTKISFFQARSI